MFYISLFKEWKNLGKFTVNEKIVYSFLVNYATMHQFDSWDNASEIEYGEKKLNMDIIKEDIEEYQHLEFRKITNKKIAEKTGLSLRTISTILNRFKEIDILKEIKCEYDELYYRIIIPRGVIDKGFLDLPKNTGLKGMQLVFWAFINERLKHYNKNTRKYNNIKLDTWASRLATDMGIKKKDVQNYIHCLTQRDYLRRSENGKYLWVNVNMSNTKTTKEVSFKKTIKFNTNKECSTMRGNDLPF